MRCHENTALNLDRALESTTCPCTRKGAICPSGKWFLPDGKLILLMPRYPENGTQRSRLPRTEIFTQWEMSVTSGNGLSRQHLEAFQKEHECILRPVPAFFKDEQRVPTSRKGQDGVGWRGYKGRFLPPYPQMPFPYAHGRTLTENTVLWKYLGWRNASRAFKTESLFFRNTYIIKWRYLICEK